MPGVNETESFEVFCFFIKNHLFQVLRYVVLILLDFVSQFVFKFNHWKLTFKIVEILLEIINLTDVVCKGLICKCEGAITSCHNVKFVPSI